MPSCISLAMKSPGLPYSLGVHYPQQWRIKRKTKWKLGVYAIGFVLGTAPTGEQIIPPPADLGDGGQ